jgi:hypothetical protein
MASPVCQSQVITTKGVTSSDNQGEGIKPRVPPCISAVSLTGIVRPWEPVPGTPLVDKKVVPVEKHELPPSSFEFDMEGRNGRVDRGIQEAVGVAVDEATEFIKLFHVAVRTDFHPGLLKVELVDLFQKCEREFTKLEKVALARSDAEDLVLPRTFYTRDLDSLTELRSLEKVVELRQHENSRGRLNRQRWIDECGGLPEPLKSTIEGIASKGVTVILPEGFVRQPEPEPVRRLGLSLGNCFLKHAVGLWESNKVLIFRLSDIPIHILESLSFTNCGHWCPKADSNGIPNPGGRFVVDASNAADEYLSLNSTDSFEKLESIYGKMALPTIRGIVNAWFTYMVRHGYDIRDMRIWKDDVKGAFNQFNFEPRSAKYWCILIAHNLVMIYIVGLFGWHAAPMVWAVIARSLLVLIHGVIKGTLHMYVDDFIGFAHVNDAANDQSLAQGRCRALLGEDCLASKNQPPHTEVEVLGWFVSLTRGSFRPNDRGIRKMFFAFFVTVDLSAKKWSLQECQILASLAERYSVGIIGAAPFVYPLHHMCGNSTSDTPRNRTGRSLRRVTSSARFAVTVWRALTVMLYLDREAMAVPLLSLIDEHRTVYDYNLISDAADSLGVAVYDSRFRLLFYTTFLLPFDAHRSDFQNTREFLGTFLSLLLMYRHSGFKKGLAVSIRGDNIAALSWVENNRCSSSYAQTSFLAYSWFVILSQVVVGNVEHIAGILMEDIDRLSRNLKLRSLPSELFMPSSNDTSLGELFRLCDPTLVHDLQDHFTVFKNVQRCLAHLGII